MGPHKRRRKIVVSCDSDGLGPLTAAGAGATHYKKANCSWTYVMSPIVASDIFSEPVILLRAGPVGDTRLSAAQLVSSGGC